MRTIIYNLKTVMMMIATMNSSGSRFGMRLVQSFTIPTIPTTTVSVSSSTAVVRNRYPHSLMTQTSLLSSSSSYTRSTRRSSSSSSSSQLHAVATKKDVYTITVLPGDGIGPEITQATNVVLDAICTKFDITLNRIEMSIGGDAIDRYQDPFPHDTYEQCKVSDSILLACIGGYKWDSNPRELRPESGLLRLRQQLGLYANLRPAKVMKQLMDASTLKSNIIENVDIMVVRELTGDVYFGTPKGIDIIDGTYMYIYIYIFVIIFNVTLAYYFPSLLFFHPSLIISSNLFHTRFSFVLRGTSRIQQYDLQGE
jgi:Isocitrate/isopropylmalate dehydrogenase